jgi:hypothetical protein
VSTFEIYRLANGLVDVSVRFSAPNIFLETDSLGLGGIFSRVKQFLWTL